MARHKHADLIIAWANGAEIEYKRNDCWVNILTPNWSNVDEYRVKPEPKPDFVRYMQVWEVSDSFEDTITTSLARIEKYVNHNVKLIFDGETLKLKSAEVLK